MAATMTAATANSYEKEGEGRVPGAGEYPPASSNINN